MASKRTFLILFLFLSVCFIAVSCFFWVNSGSFPSDLENQTPFPDDPVTSFEKIYDAESDSYLCSYAWSFDGRPYALTLTVPKETYDFYNSKERVNRNYDYYALTEYDRPVLNQMIDSFETFGEEYNLTEAQTVLNMIAFVQSMPYSSDSLTTGYDEYPRYPIETLVDGGGDCEDSSILAAALLTEMGYQVVLIGVSNHMGLGVASSNDISGTFYEYDGDRYYYVETTSADYVFGELPEKYAGESAEIFPMNPQPFVYVTIWASHAGTGSGTLSYRIVCNITNHGPATAQNVSIRMFAQGPPYDLSRSLGTSSSVSLGIMADDEMKSAANIIQVPRGSNVCFTCVVSGDNFEPVTASTNIIYIN